MPWVTGYLIAAGLGALLGWMLTIPVELRVMRIYQMALAPWPLLICWHGLRNGGMPGFVLFLAGLIFLILLLIPNLSWLAGAGFVDFLQNADWTPSEEEIALRPIRRLIDRENYRQALGELEALLPRHPPTYEAVLLRAKLLNHIGRVDEAAEVLLQLLPLTRSFVQQLSVMSMFDSLERNIPAASPPPIRPGAHRLQIGHELVLFQIGADSPAPHKEIPPGAYSVEEILQGSRRWLKLAGENWGNAEDFWRAVPVAETPAARTAPTGLMGKILNGHQAMIRRVRRKSYRENTADARELFQQARQHLDRNEWSAALPLLQKASASHPDNYEYAYRWVQAVRQTADAATTAKALDTALHQSRWTQSELDMFNQLGSP